MQLLIILIALLSGLALVAWIVSSAATYNQAQAVVETARVAQIASAGQTVSAINVTILTVLLVLVIIAALAFCLFVFYRYRRFRARMVELVQSQQQAAMAPGRWKPGPNARFQREDYPRLPASAQQDPTTALVQLYALDMLSRMHRAETAPAGQQPPADDPWRW